MMIRRRALITGLVVAAPAAAVITFTLGRFRANDLRVTLERVVRSQVNDQVRERCESDPNWFLTGPLEGRPRRGEVVDPDMPPRPKTDPQPFELFAYDEDFAGTSTAAPRFPQDFRIAMRRSSAPAVASFASATGAGAQVAVATGWNGSPCMYFLGRMQPPPGQRSQRMWVAAGSFALCYGIVLLGMSPVIMRIRRLARDASASVREGYATIAPDKLKDELSSVTFTLNDAFTELHHRKTRIQDQDEALRRFVSTTNDDVTEPMKALEQEMAAAAGRSVSPEWLTRVHALAMKLENLAAAARLRMTRDSIPATDVDLGASVERVVARDAALAAAAGVSVETAVKSGAVMVTANQAMLERAIANLLDNAVRYNRPGGRVHVNLSKAADSGFSLRITDNGRGMTEDEFKSLTAIRRFRGDEGGPNRRPGAPGLGLSLAREIFDRSGMQMELRRPPTGGFEAEIQPRA